MSSSQTFVASSPPGLNAGASNRRKSQFTYRHLAQLATFSTTCPLRVIAHIDLDAFYAQCEMIRLDVPEDRPLAVQQWQGLIAINYPARKFGISRHATITDAKKACPELIMQHVATWKEGDEKWSYHRDAFQQMATHKVSLDPYRSQSRKILALIKEVLPAPPKQRVEKASIDEVFLDLSAQVHSILLERYPELQGPAPYDDPSESLPRPPTTALDWKADALVDLDGKETEDDDPDWDDIAMLIGSEIVRSVRAAIKERLRYTCSAGIAHNKMLSKLGSAHKKPNQQTIVRNRAIQQFLSGMKFTKIRNLGGKLGDQVVEIFGTDLVKDILNVSLDQLKFKLGDDTGSWVHLIIRGGDSSEVNSRTQIKSMLSAKSFRPSINHFEQGVRWLRIFVADIFSRLVEEGVLENKRRPKTITLHHRQGGQTRSRQAPIPQGRQIEEAILFDLSKNLLSQIVVEGTAWPCANLSLSVGGFEDGPTSNQGIGAFLVRGEEAKPLVPVPRDVMSDSGRPEKRRKVDSPRIQSFFARKESSNEDHGTDEECYPDNNPLPVMRKDTETSGLSVTCDERKSSPFQTGYESSNGHDLSRFSPKNLESTRGVADQQATTSTFCDSCGASMPLNERDEHNDWHFAQALQNEEKFSRNAGGSVAPSDSANEMSTSRHPSLQNRNKATVKKNGNATSSSKSGKIGKNQSKLAFGT
ncbi:MAG: DNA-directed DNA polymerase eta rad30 [Sclerophora amabilis]|nr:MAG: DNA-directed DNA polymerase eta rad30 [Sclerophora amabilis]